MPHSNYAAANRLENTVGGIIKLESLIKKSVARADREAALIEEAIQNIPDPRNRELLRLYYLDGLTWEAVAEKLELSRQWVSLLAALAINSML